MRTATASATACLALCLLALETSCEPAAGRHSDQTNELKDTAASKENKGYWMELGRGEISQALREVTRSNAVAKNIVLFVGDGMSMPTVTATRIYKEQQLKRNFETSEKAYLTFERFENLAHSKTYSLNEQVPDSAATASALFSGVKTHSMTMGFDSSIVPKKPESMLTATEVETVLTWAQEAHKKTGIVTTTRVTHATPAALYAHTCDRDWECDRKVPNGTTAPDGTHDIAWQLVRNRPGNATNVIMGGGLSAFISKKDRHQYAQKNVTWNCYREDGDDLLEAWKAWHGPGAKTVHNLQELRSLDASTDFVFGLFSEDHVSFEDQRDKDVDPSIVDMTAKSLELLLNNKGKGFFLMVEGGRIDHAHHETQAVRALNEAMYLDLAVEETVKVLKKANQLDDTLIIVTSDHAHTMSINGYPARGNDIRGLSGKMYADGLPYTTLSYSNDYAYFRHNIPSPSGNNVTRRNLSTLPTEEVTSFDFQQTSAAYNGETHGGDDVAIFARGPMAHLFHSTHEQTHVAWVMAYGACIGPYAGQPACKYGRSSAASISSLHLSLILGLALVATRLRIASCS